MKNDLIRQPRVSAARNTFLVLLAFATLILRPSTGFAQGTAFTYQGRFTDNGVPYTGNVEIQATLWDAVSGGSQIAASSPAQVLVGVTNGLFVLPLNFGANFPGANRWLQLEVRTTLGAFIPLTPRQPLMPTPYAITAANLSGPVAAANITGTISLGQLPAALVTNGASGVNLSGNLSGTFSGNGAGVTGVDLLTVNSRGAISFAANYGTFVLASSPGVGSGPYSVTTADVNGDGKADLISANYDEGNGNTLTVLTNNGSGGFVLASSPAVGSGPISVAAADVNGDGKTDLISANNSTNTLTVLTNNGSGGFVPATSPVVGNGPSSVAAADVNGDGKTDLISANYAVSGSGNTLTVLMNNESGGFVLASSPVVGNGPSSVAAADVNGDGKTDLISANYLAGSGNTLTVLANTATYTGVFSGTVSGNGSGLISLNANNLDSGTVPAAALNNAWKITGNSGTTPDTHFLGTTGNQPLEFKVNNQRALRIEYATNVSYGYSPNVLGGFSGNIVSNGFVGAVIGGGGYSSFPNRVGDHFATIVGGRGNTASGFVSTAMGAGTRASGAVSTAMGADTTASGNISTAMGYATTASDFASTAMGYRAKANHSGTFVWADSQSADFTSTAANQFSIRASGGVQLSGGTSMSFGSTLGPKINLYGTAFGLGIQNSVQYSRVGVGGGFGWYAGGVHNDNTFNSGGGTTLMTLTGGGLTVNGTVVSASDRNGKENFAPVQPRAMLEKVLALSLSSWNYKADPATRHLGPMAQDFFAAFNVGPDDKHIATVDADGVALAAIQGLNQKLEEKDTEIQNLRVRLEKVEQLLTRSLDATARKSP